MHTALGREGLGTWDLFFNRTRALIICTRPRNYAPARLREAARGKQKR